MGTKRREAQSRRLIRMTKAIEQRETLRSCEACSGEGARILEFENGTYRKVKCSWCDDGMTDKDTARMFARWRKIQARNKCRH